MIKGNITNNTGRSKHIFKRTVYPGQSVPLDYVHKLLSKKVPKGESFINWLKLRLPKGWELEAVEVAEATDAVDGRPYKEVLTAIPEVVPSDNAVKGSAKESEEDSQMSMQYATPRAIDKMSSKDIYNLKLKDNPKRVLRHITSIHKLRRALTLCKNDSRKAVLTRLIQGRIRQLNVTL